MTKKLASFLAAFLGTIFNRIFLSTSGRAMHSTMVAGQYNGGQQIEHELKRKKKLGDALVD